MIVDETWRAVPGYEGRYEVSDHGRVRSLLRGLMHPWHGFGYPMVRLYDGAYKNMRVHRLVLMAFVGPCPEGMEACHNDGDRANARLSNLRWDTHAANIEDRKGHGNFKKACSRGHAFDADNTRIGRRGERICIACTSRRAREAYLRRTTTKD